MSLPIQFTKKVQEIVPPKPNVVTLWTESDGYKRIQHMQVYSPESGEITFDDLLKKHWVVSHIFSSQNVPWKALNAAKDVIGEGMCNTPLRFLGPQDGALTICVSAPFTVLAYQVDIYPAKKR